MLSIFKLNSDVNYESSYLIKIWMPSQTFICLLLLVVVGHRRRPLHHIVTYLRVAYPTKAHVSCIVRALIKIRIIRKRSVSSVFIRPCENERNEGGWEDNRFSDQLLNLYGNRQFVGGDYWEDDFLLQLQERRSHNPTIEGAMSFASLRNNSSVVFLVLKTVFMKMLENF